MLVALPLAAFSATEVRDQLSPHQRVILDAKSPPPVDSRFSFDAPAGPQFTEAEKEAQRERGREVMPMVMKAFEGGAGEVRIPPEIILAGRRIETVLLRETFSRGNQK